MIDYLDQVPYHRQSFSGFDLVLLSKDKNRYTFAKSAFSSLPVSKEARSTYSKSENADTNLRWEMINSVQDTSYKIVSSALNQSYLFSKDDIAAYVKPRVSDSDSRIRIEAMAVCVAAGDQTLIPQAVQLVLEHMESVDLVYTPYAAKLQGVVMDDMPILPEHVHLFANALASNSARVREFASYVLRRSKNPAALPFLKTALNDSEAKVRYNAVMGLALATGDTQHAPAFQNYLSDEKSYLDYWKDKAVQ